MKTKICTKCDNEKTLNEFKISKDGKFGVTSRCKDCDKRYYQENKEQIKQKVKKYREQHKDELNKKHKEYIKKNKDKYINRKLIFLYGITLHI
jgi:Zn-finger protein